jgi:DNA-binding response OmpR family regulator
MKKILVLEDETDIRSFIVINLNRLGFTVLEASSGEEALELIENNSDIMIALLDVMLPGIDGLEVCKRIRTKNKDMGIIMLTAKSQEMDKVNGLSLGADDYVIKPFSTTELIARIDALLRRINVHETVEKEQIVVGPFKLDKEARILYKNQNQIELTQVEFALIKMFLENPSKAMNRDNILDNIWGKDYFGNWKTVDVNIRRLRQKIEDNPSNPEYIQTVWGYGYRWGKGD